MKKLIIAVTAMLVSLCAGAQVFVGGNLGFSINGNGSGANIYVAPDIGYRINNQFTVGGQLSYQSSGSTFGLTPYFRWKFISIGDRVRFFISANAPLRFNRDAWACGFHLRPGATVRITDNLYLVAHVGTFGYTYARSGDAISKGWVAKVNGDNISIGFCIGI